MRQHNCRLARNPACACCLCRNKCEDDCDREPDRSELVELRRLLPLLRGLPRLADRLARVADGIELEHAHCECEADQTARHEAVVDALRLTASAMREALNAEVAAK